MSIKTLLGQAFAAALNGDFAPNAALQGALADAAKVKRA